MIRTHRLRVVALLAVATLALVAGLVAVGRWERARNADTQNARMLAVYRVATGQGLDSQLLDRYRLGPGYDCLLYHSVAEPQNVSDYELCFDAQGRLVQTIDRHTGTPRFASLLDEPSLATLRVPVRRLFQVFEAHGVFEAEGLSGAGPSAATLPTTDEATQAKSLPRRRPSTGGS